MIGSELSTGDVLGIGALVLTLWIASMGGMWKIATLLSGITAELRSLREEQAITKEQTGLNAANIVAIQRRFDVPQATEPIDQVSGSREGKQAG